MHVASVERLRDGNIMHTNAHAHGYTVIRFVSSSAKFGIGAVVGPNGTLVEAKIRTLDT
jgi:hypothetical protein